MSWKVSHPVPGRAPHSRAALVAVTRPSLRIEEIQFATPTPQSSVVYLYAESDTDLAHIAPGRLQFWGKGGKIVMPEWLSSRSEDRNFRACFVRNGTVSMKLRLVLATSAPLTG